ncbi:MAG: hypothetical protein F4186_14220 [Boseongicola sp. SB0676_bin_33]|uniref:Uncharacterized protein n=1 Tax=Boseongicola sp. SB0664_bin_43 TaxID=2604844 RepID=A0A6B0Y1I0_9RHOB|nr:hypothetical protein [Boseongicola sp. SB0664_bin_43]MYF90374.1 hypothetical protein [Boseongicola sp. SB0676_bin_33]MYK31103.1 hypothetical protein [Boseongicola sp. SB0670_bin_30]
MAFETAEPVGRNVLAAIVTEDLVDLGSLLDGHREFEPIENGLEFAGAISGRLHVAWTGDLHANTSARWPFGYVEHEIRE